MDEVIDELQTLADGCDPEWPTLHVNKWLARSGLQKAMRRGRTLEAWGCAEILFNDDKAYAWKALATVIVEDIGLGDPDLLALSTLTTMSTVTNKMKSPKRLMLAMIERACEFPKTRSACELSLGAERSPDIDWVLEKKLSDQNLWQLMFESEAPAPSVYAATVVMRDRCRKDKTGTLLNKVLAEMMARIDDTKLARAAMLSFERPVDSMNLSIWPLIHRKLLMDPLPTVVEDKLPPEAVIGGISCAAYDMHTQDGKRAIKAFHTSLTKKGDESMKMLVEAKSDVVRALGSLIFILEGGQLDRRLWSPRLTALKQYQDENFSRAWGVPPSMYQPLLNTVGANFELLNQKRVWSAEQT